MINLSGIGKLDRIRLIEVIRNTKGTISVAEASVILNLSLSKTAKILSRWAKKGWLTRISRGIYISIPLESRTNDIPLEDPWIIAEKLYFPCYIGGWSAAEYWDLTDQVFRTILVMTQRKPRNRMPVIKGTKFILMTVLDKAMFGLKPIWRGQVKVSISDPTRTVIDMINGPQSGGGIRFIVEMFINYLKSENANVDLLLAYANQLGNGAIYKRLGFLLERFAPNKETAIKICKLSLTKGNTKLDPKLKADRLVTRWRLWVTESWSKQKVG
ncbi:type IV toxin-antitoxin system AbiEi family antitoxin domain-containing protein [bacterium]|nr:type IV toxin-antitoxin system AbiEi family antitoxin domain-containing protein [bacterium]